MKPKLSPCLCIVFLIVSVICASTQSGRPTSATTVTPQNVRSLIQAIQDEIYASNLQGDGYDAGVPDGEGAYTLRLYVQSAFSGQGLAWCIYKLMPYGEVLRMFWVDRDGTVFLFGKPSGHFPPTGPSYLTLYMKDEDLLHDKERWGHVDFTIQLEPSTAEIREANERQRDRVAVTTVHERPNEAATDYRDSARAANEAAEGPDPAGGVTHYLLDYGQPLPIWATDVALVKKFGPFLKTIEGGKTPKDVKVSIVIIR